MLPFSNQHPHAQDDAGEPDPEADHLIPARKRRHRVRVQGRLAVVRSVSAANLRRAASVAPALPSPVATAAATAAVAAASGTATPIPTPATPRFESGVAGSAETPVRRRKSLDDASSDGAGDDHDARETAVRDRQFRGYGIGGAGNIRRPTEVYGSTKSSSSLPRFFIFNPSSPTDEPGRRKWGFKDLFAWAGGRKGKGVS